MDLAQHRLPVGIPLFAYPPRRVEIAKKQGELQLADLVVAQGGEVAACTHLLQPGGFIKAGAIEPGPGPGRSTQRPRPLPHQRMAVHAERVIGLDDERLVAFAECYHPVQRNTEGELLEDGPVVAVAGVLRVAGFDGQWKCVGDDTQGGPIGRAPEVDEAAKDEMHLGADVGGVEPITQGHREAAELLGACGIPELGAYHHAIDHVAERGPRRIAMRERQAHDLQCAQYQGFGVVEIRGWPDTQQQAYRGCAHRIGHARQPKQRVAAPAAQCQLDAHQFPQHAGHPRPHGHEHAKLTHRLDAKAHRVVAAALAGVYEYLGVVDMRPFHHACRVAHQADEERVGLVEAAGEVGALEQLRAQGESVLPLGGLSVDGRQSRLEHGTGVLVGHGRPSAASGGQAEPHQLGAFRRVGDPIHSGYQIRDDLEQGLLELGGRQHAAHHLPYSPAQMRSLGIVDQGIRRLLHPVMHKAVAPTGDRFDQGIVHRRAQRSRDAIHRQLQRGCDDRQCEYGADTRSNPERGPRIRREAQQASRHQRGYVVAVVTRAYFVQVPLPTAAGGVEEDQRVVVQRAQKLPHEERISSRLRGHDHRQFRAIRRRQLQCVGDNGRRVGQRDRTDVELADADTRRAQFFQRRHKQLGLTGLTVAVRAQQQQVVQRRVLRERGDQRQGCSVRPLEIVQQNDQRVQLGREQPDKLADHGIETVTRFDRSEQRGKRQWPGEQINVRDDVDQHARVRAQRRGYALAPVRHLGRRPVRELVHQRGKRLRYCGVRNIAFVLVEFAGNEGAVLALHLGPQLRGQRRFADPGRSAQQEGGAVPPPRTVEGIDQSLHFALATVQACRQGKHRSPISRAQYHVVGRPARLPRVAQGLQVECQAVCGLVPFRLRLREQPLSDRGNQRGGLRADHARVRRFARGMCVGEVGRIVRCERRLAGEQMVHQHANRVQVGAGIHAPMDTFPLLWRPVTRIQGGVAQRHRVAKWPHPHGPDADASMHQTRRMQRGQRGGHAYRDVDDAVDHERAARQKRRQRLPAVVFHDDCFRRAERHQFKQPFRARAAYYTQPVESRLPGRAFVSRGPRVAQHSGAHTCAVGETHATQGHRFRVLLRDLGEIVTRDVQHRRFAERMP